MFVNKEKIIELFHLRKSGLKGWMIGTCGFCGKDKHMGVLFGPVSSFVCKKCGKHGNLFILLKQVRRLDLINKGTYHKDVEVLKNAKIDLLDSTEISDFSVYIPPIAYPPIGFKRIYSNNYLEGRGFTKQQFELFKVGICNIGKWKNRIIFLIENFGECRGYIGRHIWTKKEIDTYNKSNPDKNKLIRYRNSEHNFQYLLFGYDEITENTVIVILVEGPTDKFNVDRMLDLYSSEYMKCCCTFGKNISDDQIKMLLDKKFNGSLTHIVVLYDFETIKESKESGLKLIDYFETEVCHFTEDKDPGEVEDYNELIELINSSQDPIAYNLNKLPKMNLV